MQLTLRALQRFLGKIAFKLCFQFQSLAKGIADPEIVLV